MADDRYQRATRGGEVYRRDAASGATDPLSELARLIGQSDPFADPPREPAREAPRPRIVDPADRHDLPAPRDDLRADLGGRESPVADPGYVPDPGYVDEPAYDPEPPGYGTDAHRPNDPYHQTGGMFPRETQEFATSNYDPPAFDPRDPLGYEARDPMSYDPMSYDHRDGGDPGRDPGDPGEGLGDRERGYGDPPQRYADVPREEAAAYDEAAYAPRVRSQAHVAADRPYAHEARAAAVERLYSDPGENYIAPEDYPYYQGDEQEAPAPRAAARPARRRGLATAAVIIGLVVVGSAGAIGYRALSSGGAAKPAPVIRADNAPNKVAPIAVTSDASKQIYDRLADKAQNEKVVSREEQPVEIRDASRPPTPRMVFPNSAAATGTGAAGPALTPPPTGQAGFATASTASSGVQEPKRVRTVPIRGDQGAPADPAARPAARPPVASAPAPTRSVDVGGPMSLTPDRAAPAAPARSAAVAPAAPSGSYVVQVSAQKTEAEASASFRSIQARYPNQLGGRAPIIKRKDTASGTMFGAQVGPFASRQEAIQMCEGLKSAGGSCFVQRN